MSLLLVDEPLPPYSYVPGKFAHPLRDPLGHKMTVPTIDDRQPFDMRDWASNRAYLRAIDLFNHGYYWEAHECWEVVWKHAGRRGAAADFLKALIKLAAALVKAREGRPVGVRRHARRAAQLLEAAGGDVASSQAMGLPLPALLQLARSLDESPKSFVNTNPEPVVKLVEIQLRPGAADPTP